MGRKGRIHGIILMLAAGWAMNGCSIRGEISGEAEIGVRFSGGVLQGKAMDPDEEKISDISLMIFNEDGSLEEYFRLEDGAAECTARLVYGKKYIFCACANFGHKVYAEDISGLDGIVCHLAYPDDYREGIPMYARQEVTVGEDCGEITVMLERLMAKISLRMDRTRLSDDVEMYARSVRIGNCPRRARVFGKNRIDDEDWFFPSGFSRTDQETAALNRSSSSGKSGTVSLYMLENMQGTLQEPAGSDEEKPFDVDDRRSRVCSYIELELDYVSGTYYSGGEGLKYRFYLGENPGSLDIERNCHYHITVAPEDDGLSDDGWKVDKSDLVYCGETRFESFPSGYIVGDIGDKVHVWCEFFPEDAPFDVGMSYMEDDRRNGIYDYVIDEDGHGATLTLTGPGTGLIYMEAGPPVNDAALFYIEVNQP